MSRQTARVLPLVDEYRVIEPLGSRGLQRRLTPMSVPAFDPKVTPINTRVIPATAPSRRARKHRGWTLLLVPPAVSASVRTLQIRPWQVRIIAGSIVPMLAAAFLGGAFLGIRSDAEESAGISARLMDTERRLSAVGDSLRAMQIMAMLSPASSGSLSAPATKAHRSSVAWEPPRPAAGVILPVDGRISSVYSLRRRHPILRIRRPHRGVDIVAPSGTSVTAPAPGRVISVERNFSFGLVVEIEHANGVRTRYAHLRSAMVSDGDQVVRGNSIATVGSSGLSNGPHLHYEVSVNGRAVNPLKYVFPASLAEPLVIPEIPALNETQDSTMEEAP